MELLSFEHVDGFYTTVLHSVTLHYTVQVVLLIRFILVS